MQPVLARTATLLANAHVCTTSDDDSFVRQYALPLDGASGAQPLPPTAKRFETGHLLCYTQVLLQWKPSVTLDMLQHAVETVLEHLCMLALPVHVQLHIPTTTLGTPLKWHHGPCNDPAQAAATAIADMLHPADSVDDILAVAGDAVNNAQRPTYVASYLARCYIYHRNHTRWAACAVLVLQPTAHAADPPSTPQPDQQQWHPVPVYLFHDHAPTVHLPALEGVQRARWHAGGLEAADMLLAQGPVEPASRVGTHQATLMLAPPGTAASIQALVVHVQPCRQHPARPLPPTVELRIVRRAVEAALAAAKVACPGAFLSVAEQRLEVALPALAAALAGIAVRSRDGALLQAAAHAAGQSADNVDDLAEALCTRLRALAQL